MQDQQRYSHCKEAYLGGRWDICPGSRNFRGAKFLLPPPKSQHFLTFSLKTDFSCFFQSKLVNYLFKLISSNTFLSMLIAILKLNDVKCVHPLFPVFKFGWPQIFPPFIILSHAKGILIEKPLKKAHKENLRRIILNSNAMMAHQLPTPDLRSFKATSKLLQNSYGAAPL